MSLPPIPGAATTATCHWPDCTMPYCANVGYHQAAILIIPEPGLVLGVVMVRWDDDEADAYWNRHVDEHWTLGLPLPVDPPVEMASEVEKARGLLATHTPARELVSAR